MTTISSFSTLLRKYSKGDNLSADRRQSTIMLMPLENWIKVILPLSTAKKVNVGINPPWYQTIHEFAGYCQQMCFLVPFDTFMRPRVIRRARAGFSDAAVREVCLAPNRQGSMWTQLISRLLSMRSLSPRFCVW